MTILVGVTIAAFIGTRAVARGNEALRRREAAAWFEAGQRAVREGQADAAVAALRRAVAKDTDNRQYRLALAGALAANGLAEETERVLLALRQAQPEDPEANLQLARLAAPGPDTDATRRYYQSALAGMWRPEQAEERRRVRVELIEFLLDRKERARALSEVLVFAADLPQDAEAHARVGRMFLDAGDPRPALDHFTQAIGLDSRNDAALAGAGKAAFALGDYTRALRYLDAVSEVTTETAELHELARLVLDGDPLAPRLRASERRRRVALALEQATSRLEACFGDPPPASRAELEPLRSAARELQDALARPARRDAPDLVDDGLDLAFRIERAADGICRTPPAPLDRALLLIGRRHGLDDR